MAKRRKKRIDPAAKFALVFALVFVIAVAALIPVMDRYSAQKLQENIDKAEAEHQYLMDLSWIDSDYSLTWLAELAQYELNADDEWEHIDTETQLRTYDFASGSFSDMPVELDGGYGLTLLPSDDPRGYVLAEEVGDYWSIFRIDENGKPVRLLREKNKNIRDIFCFYGGKLYFDAYTDADKPLSLFSWDSASRKTYQYRNNALCINPDGRAVIEIERDTGLYETHLSMYDDEGKLRDEPVEEQVPIMGGTLGIEDAQGNWMPLLNTGADSAFFKVACAAWMDNDRLILVASTNDSIYTYALYIYTLSGNAITPFTDLRGEVIYMDEPPVSGSMVISPDHRYIAYHESNSGFKYDGPPKMMVQSLENGRYAQVCPQDDIIDGNLGISIDVKYGMNTPIWTQ